MSKNLFILILFLGIILTLYKDYWFLGITLMFVGFYKLK